MGNQTSSLCAVCGAPSVVGGRRQRRPAEQKVQRSAAATRTEPRVVDFTSADPSKWQFSEVSYNGGYSYHTEPVIEKVTGPISQGMEKFKSSPSAYDGIMYQSDMVSWPEDQQEYSLVRRTGSCFRVQPEDGAAFTWVEAKYQALVPLPDVEHDMYTDKMCFQGNSLGAPVCPGRGQGVADVPGLKIIGDIDPSDVAQGQVGDCWLLSAISALAEFDGAIARIFRKTQELQSLPSEAANTYVLSVCDVATWTEVDITVDERLCGRPGGKGLLGCAPSVDGELWVCYLEKALAAHCGGWDQIDGGTCTHAFRLLTGCKDVYSFREDARGFRALGALNPNTGQWEQLANSPHGGFKGLWPMPWPEVGGGGDLDLRLNRTDMFHRMCDWEDANFVMCAGTKAGSDSEATDGIVDGHAYTILACIENVGETGINMIKVRNPWGRGEFQTGKWDDDGPGWTQYPEIKAACNPVAANDGVFWLEQEEFFQYFKQIYLCALDMKGFIEGA